MVLIKSAGEKRDSDDYSNNFCAIIMVKIILYKLDSLSVQILALCIIRLHKNLCILHVIRGWGKQ